MSAEAIVEQRLKEAAKETPSSIFDAGFNSVVNAAAQNFLREGWSATVQKVALMEKVATSQIDDDFVAGQEAAIDLLSTLSEDEYLSLIQGEMQMSFELGKEAAYGDFVEMAENGAGCIDVLEAVQNTLSSEMEKYASEEDVDYRLGVDAACYQFLKVANEIFGEYDVTGADDSEILDAILLKIAKDERSADEIRAKLNERYGRHGNLGGVGSRPGAKKKMVQKALERNLGERPVKQSLLPPPTPEGPSLRERISQAPDLARYTMKNLSRNEKIGLGAGAAALGAAGLAGGAYALHKRRQAKKEQEKSASDYQIQAALDVLAEAGLLDD